MLALFMRHHLFVHSIFTALALSGVRAAAPEVRLAAE
jgi:hypothetical protein